MPSEVINVGKAVREQAYVSSGSVRKTIRRLKVQENAVQEEISFLLAKIECDLNLASRYALEAGRSTVMEDDIIKANGSTTDRTKGRQDESDAKD